MVSMEKSMSKKIQRIHQCDSDGRQNDFVVVNMDGALLVERNPFAYFSLVAFDVGGILRFFILVLVSPFALFFYHMVSESLGIKVLVFATFFGVRVSEIKSAARVVLPKFYSEDLHPKTWSVFSSCRKKCVVTATPRIMVEPFLKDYLGADVVLGTEISSYKGFATGFVANTGVLVGRKKAIALRKEMSDESMPNIGIGSSDLDFPFMELCKEMYIVPSSQKVQPLKPSTLPKPVVFHDGRLVCRPTPSKALLLILWFPIGLSLSLIRAFFVCVLPLTLTLKTLNLLGCPIIIKGVQPKNLKSSSEQNGVVFICNHRTLLDPIYVSACLGESTPAITYSLSSFSEIMSPIKTYRATRDRAKDAKLMQTLLSHGCFVMSPEGTTCREPYLLRFSKLFAELTDEIAPVAINVRVSMFYGTTARGHKWLDWLFFFMNPKPIYEVTFLNKLPRHQSCHGGKSSQEVANGVQEMIAKVLNFQCTNLTRKDKYQLLNGTNGFVN
ncbi:glycerol-3-phosphate acyltransferase RAM2-like [Andrographis paniculata]|uniref:glycerol-3-phosphate acyltransferase RAM2-like n=1 Tax=Andrographis paniculata TaxID=175694 RepID=UPI0021E8BD1C|nr:glycerol-3-phosphate acyltransferase RAM2-like [Andrographis paniculata]